MRRTTASLLILPILLLLLAGPVAAAPPTKTSGASEFMFAFSSSCGPSTCTDTLLDVFTIAEDVIVVCVSEFTYNIRSGRQVSDDSACSEPISADALQVSDDLSSGSLAPTAVTYVSCNQRGCVEHGTVTVSAELNGFGTVFTDTQRFTFDDGICTYRFSSSGEQRQATGTISVDGETLSAEGNIGMGTFTEMVRCR